MISQNKIISVIIKAGIESVDADVLASDYNSYFTTNMVPLFATVNDVRKRVGRHIASVTDDTINQLNFYFGQMASAITDCDVSDPKWRYFANQWVAINTSLVLLDNNEAFTGATGESISKVLGDFEISKRGPSSTPAKFSDLIDRLQCELYKLEPAVRKCSNPLTSCAGMEDPKYTDYDVLKPDTFVRGSEEINYPLIGRRWLTRDLPIATDYLYAFSRLYKTRFGYR